MRPRPVMIKKPGLRPPGPIPRAVPRPAPVRNLARKGLPTPPPQAGPPPAPSRVTNLLQKVDRPVIALYLAYAIYQSVFAGNFLGTVCGTMVIACSLLPAWLWLKSKVQGFPIMPLFAGTYSYTYGMQFLTNQKILGTANSSEVVYSCEVLCCFLLLSCAIWRSLVPNKPILPSHTKMLGSGRRSVRLLLSLFGAFTFYSVASAGGWIEFLGDVDSAVRLAIFGFGSLSTFALCYLLGEKKLSSYAKWLFIGMFLISVMASACSLILITSYSLWFLSIAGFAMGSRRIPWRALLLMVPIILMLQYGKYSMRANLWATEEDRYSFTLQPWEYPEFYAEWLDKSFSYDTDRASAEDMRYGLLERASLLQQFVLIQQISPKYEPYMGGTTYSAVFSAILPRFFFPNKISSLESTNMISVYYGLQSREETDTTTIGWGLFNEAFANYGFWGTVWLALVVGGFIGLVTRFTMGYPLLSGKGLFAIIVMTNAIQSEFTSATIAACLFQATGAILVLSIFAMETVPIPKELAVFSLSFNRPPPPKKVRKISPRSPGQVPAT